MTQQSAPTNDNRERARLYLNVYPETPVGYGNYTVFRIQMWMQDNNAAYSGEAAGSWSCYFNGGLVDSGSGYYYANNTYWFVNTTRTVYHNANGELSLTSSAGFYGNSPAGTGIGVAEVSFWVEGISNFNHNANTPYYNNIARDSSNLTHFTLGYAATGNVSGYGGTSYTLECATNSAMNQNYSTVAAGENYSFNAYTGYYFRMYAVGAEGGAVYSSVYGPYYGMPYAPDAPSVIPSTSVAGRIDVSWNTPVNSGTSGYGSIQYYHVYRNGSYIAQVAGNSFADTGLTRGTSHTYQVYALGSSYWSPASTTSASVMAPGVPSAPGIPSISSKVGRTVTINSSRGSNGYGNSVSEYRIQLSTDGGVTWRGWDNSTKSFTSSGTYNVLDSSGNFQYQLLTPALTYSWRVFAVNSIGTGDIATTASGTFVSSGGKRWTGTEWKPTEIAKRWNGSQWVDITIAKRYNGTSWVDLT